MAYEVFNLETDESHGTYDTLSEARGCVRFDRLETYSIWRGDVRVECCDDDHDPENIYGLASIRQSIEEDRAR